MLWAPLAISALLLTGFVAITYRRGQVHSTSVSSLHHQLDVITVRAVQGVRNGTAAVIQFARSDVLLKGLHVVTYVALICVRFVERQLVHVVHILRSFRKERTPRRSTHKLAQADDVVVETDTQVGHE